MQSLKIILLEFSKTNYENADYTVAVCGCFVASGR